MSINRIPGHTTPSRQTSLNRRFDCDTQFDDENLGDDTFSCKGIQDDRIAHDKIAASFPIGDPREYFLKIFDIRLAQVLRRIASILANQSLCVHGARPIKAFNFCHLIQKEQRPHLVMLALRFYLLDFFFFWDVCILPESVTAAYLSKNNETRAGRRRSSYRQSWWAC